MVWCVVAPEPKGKLNAPFQSVRRDWKKKRKKNTLRGTVIRCYSQKYDEGRRYSLVFVRERGKMWCTSVLTDMLSYLLKDDEGRRKLWICQRKEEKWCGTRVLTENSSEHKLNKICPLYRHFTWLKREWLGKGIREGGFGFVLSVRLAEKGSEKARKRKGRRENWKERKESREKSRQEEREV